MIEPASEAEAAEAVRDARGPLRIVGGGTRGGGGEGEPLSTARLSGIKLHEPGALTLVAAAGTPVEEAEATLASAGQRLAFEPPDWRALLGETAPGGTGAPTLGGLVATNASGPRRVQAGACRDALLGVRFVTGEGVAVKNGGRVMKNVTGYDLVRLMAGSRGSLGVLTEVAFKVLPAPGAAATLAVEGLDVPRSAAAMAAALGSPYDVSGAARDAAGRTLIRVEGLAASVAHRAAALARLLAPFGEVAVDNDRESVAATWAAIRDCAAFAGLPGDVWRLSVRPSHAARALEALAPERAVLDWGGGLIWALSRPGDDLRARLTVPGHATLIRGAATAARPVLHPEPAPVAALSAGLRARFDPRGVLGAPA